MLTTISITNPRKKNHGTRSKNGFNYYTTKFAVPMLDDNQNIAGYNVYNAQIIAAVGQDRKLRLHDLDEIKADRDRPVIKQSGIHRISANDDNISQPSDVVNKDFSLRYDEKATNTTTEVQNPNVMQNAPFTSEMETESDGRMMNLRYASNTITATTTDAERATILKGKKITAPVYRGEATEIINNNKNDLESEILSLKKAALIRVADEFKIFTNYNVDVVALEVSLSRKNIKGFESSVFL